MELDLDRVFAAGEFNPVDLLKLLKVQVSLQDTEQKGAKGWFNFCEPGS